MSLSLQFGVKSDPIEYRYSYEWLFRILANKGVPYVQIGIQRPKLRREIVKEYGADVYINSSEDVVSRCRKETGDEGLDVVITTSGSVEVHDTSRVLKWARIAATSICLAVWGEMLAHSVFCPTQSITKSAL